MKSEVREARAFDVEVYVKGFRGEKMCTWREMQPISSKCASRKEDGDNA